MTDSQVPVTILSSSLALTTELAAKLEALVRSGVAPFTAAEAAGVSQEQFQVWIERAEAEPGPYRELRDKLAHAAAEARASAEIELRTTAPASWLQRSAAPPKRISPRRKSRDQRIKRLRRQILVASPALDDPKFGPLLASFARITLLALDGYEFLREHGLTGDSGELRSSVDQVQRVISVQLKLAHALGLSPSSVSPGSRVPFLDLDKLRSANESE